MGNTQKNNNESTKPAMPYDTLLCDVRNKLRQLFVTIDIEEAKERGFSFVGNVHGDEINLLNCRSIWRDDKNRAWHVKQFG